MVGTDKKIPLPKKPPAYDVMRQRTDAAETGETPSLPKATVKVQEITPAPEAAVAVKTPVEDKTAAPAAVVEKTDALAMLQVLPDHLFRIGPNGIQPALSDGSRAANDAASALPGNNGSADGQAMADENGSSKLPGKAVLEELARQHEPHTKKALETRQLQTFELQVRGDKEAHDLEVRLAPLGQSEVLALVRDVTDKVQRHNALIESRNELENHLKDRNAELIRVNKMLKGEVDLRGEQEEILKKNFHRLERLLEDTIGAITLIVEERDPHVADHQRRVGRLACAIGQDMKLRNDQMRAVRMAAQLHDLGKIFIPAEILRKPGKLTPAEMSVIKTHPDTDYRILKRIDFPISIADVVRQHHERMDGSGYPQGLKGEGILLEARILAVADVIEGMVFERPYRVAPGLEAALKEIADNKGTLYDAAVAEACLKLFAEDRFKFEPTSGGDDAAKAGLDRGGQDL